MQGSQRRQDWGSQLAILVIVADAEVSGLLKRVIFAVFVAVEPTHLKCLKREWQSIRMISNQRELLEVGGKAKNGCELSVNEWRFREDATQPTHGERRGLANGDLTDNILQYWDVTPEFSAERLVECQVCFDVQVVIQAEGPDMAR
jgi:hypothetical protein